MAQLWTNPKNKKEKIRTYMVFTKKTAKGRYKSVKIPLATKDLSEEEIKNIRLIQREAIDNFIAHRGVELIPAGQTGNPEMVKKRGWGAKKSK